MKKGKFTNVGFAIMESHVHIKGNPKASTRCDGQSLYFHFSRSVFTMILMPLGFKKIFILTLTIFHYQVIKCLFLGGIGSCLAW